MKLAAGLCVAMVPFAVAGWAAENWHAVGAESGVLWLLAMGALVVGLSVVAAWVEGRWMENPVRGRRGSPSSGPILPPPVVGPLHMLGGRGDPDTGRRGDPCLSGAGPTGETRAVTPATQP